MEKRSVNIDELVLCGRIGELEVGKKFSSLYGYYFEEYVDQLDSKDGSLFQLKLLNDVRLSVKSDSKKKIKYISLSIYSNNQVDFKLNQIFLNNWSFEKLNSYLKAENKKFIIDIKLNGLIKIFKIEEPKMEIVISYEDSQSGMIEVISVFDGN